MCCVRVLLVPQVDNVDGVRDMSIPLSFNARVDGLPVRHISGVPRGSLQCTEVVEEPTLFVIRGAYYNFYHAGIELYVPHTFVSL
jgi:hypothetical protein